MWQDVLPTATKTRINRAFCVEDAENIVAYIAGLHDLGKCSPPFALRGLHENKQTKDLLKLYKGTPFEMSSVKPAMDAPHGYVTAVELPQILKNLNFIDTFAKQIGILIGGHHGVFPSSQKLNDLKLESYIGNSDWKNARIELAETLAKLLKIKPIQQAENLKLDNGTIMILAGLVSVADWIGSDTQFFDCAVEDFTAGSCELKQGSLECYLDHANTQAQTALEKLGWLNWPEITEPSEFQELFPFEPRGLQSEAIKIASELETPGIVVIESPMGEGKTEAAMFLADTWNANLNQRGIYFALPTQATSNQMFGRVKEFLGERFDKGIVNLQLQHGHSSLSAEFKTLKDGFQNIQGVYEECSGDDCVPHVVAAEWFTYRKRGLLAPFGVGTIDQALMAVLQTKHVFVRLFGLAHKTIIIDEVHAYDAYMSTLLERLLEWLAALGSPVILLSATLPKNRRNALIQAYQKGLGAETRPVGSVPPDAETRTVVSVPPDAETRTVVSVSDHYPRISYATDSTMNVRHIESSTKSTTLHLKKVYENFVTDLKAKLEKAGGCVAIICNTVKRSQDLYEQLSRDGFFTDKIDLLHSRFRYCDREEREKRVLQRFGKPDENGKSLHRPKFAVLIATQIIEQSLDLDFDLMISDLAPIDLLLQRAGRLHRHDRERPIEFATPTLWVIQPPTDENGQLLPDKKGLPDFGKAGVIYDKHILLRTWLELNKLEQIKIPSEIENLIEAVYDLEKPCEILDESLKQFWQQTLSNCLKSISDEEFQAEDRYIKRPGYSRHLSGIFTNNLEEDSPQIHKTLQAMTRLIEPTATVICLWEKDGKTFLDDSCKQEIDVDTKPFLEQTKELLRCSVGISMKSVVFKLFAEEVPKGWQSSALLRNHRVLKFDENRICEKFGHTFCLNKNLGLQII